VVINPLQRAAKRIEHIAAGDLTVAEEVTGRSEIGRLTHDLQLMQHSLVKTVTTVRDGAEEIYRGTSEISAGTPIFLHVLSSRLQRLSRPQPVWKSLRRP
jgi:methyl-accepting chemotaxis protein-3 (ribose and galactose sensor receptor)